MIQLMNKFEIFKNKPNAIPLIIIFLSTLIPFIEFLNSNINEKEFILNYNYLIFFCVCFLILFVIFKSISHVSNINKNYISILVSFVFWLTFQHESIKRFFESLKDINYDLLNFATQLSIYSILIVICLVILFRKKNFFNSFLLIFLLLNFFYSSVFLISKIDFSIPTLTYSSKEKIKLQQKNARNIYFIIVDTMMPIRTFEKYANKDYENLDQFKKDFKKYGYEYIHNTVNPYGTTAESLGVMFKLNENDQEGIWKKTGNVKTLVFPEILKKKYDTPLIRELRKLNYDFKWFGNSWADCLKFNISYCINKNSGLYLDTYLLSAFLSKSPFKQMFIDNYKFFNPEGFFNTIEEKDNALIAFTKLTRDSNIQNQSTFFLIHTLYPHPPYIYDQNCNRQEPGYVYDLEKFKKTYICVSKQIIDFIKYLEIKDKNALVIFQGDHNWPYFDTTEHGRTDELDDRNRIFNLIKKNVKCKKDLPKNFNNLKTINYILTCLRSSEKI